jgi:hypothetical protein
MVTIMLVRLEDARRGFRSPLHPSFRGSPPRCLEIGALDFDGDALLGG